MVNHDILFDKLYHYGICGQALECRGARKVTSLREHNVSNATMDRDQPLIRWAVGFRKDPF